MSTYPQRVADNILPLSQAGTLPEAFKEWHFDGETEDHEQAIEVCELCNQEQLRYHFKIVNRHTNKDLWKGSKCICFAPGLSEALFLERIKILSVGSIKGERSWDLESGIN